MPEEEEDGEKKEKGKNDKKNKNDKDKSSKTPKDKTPKDKTPKDQSPPEKSPKVKSPKVKSPKGRESGRASTKGSVKSSAKSSGAASPALEKDSVQSSKSKAEKSEASVEAPKKSKMGPYKAPAPSESMLKAMASQGPVFAERVYNDDYEDADENRNYVEVQVFHRTPSGTIISREPGCSEGGAQRTQSYYVDVPPVHVSARPAYDDYYEERPLARRERQSKQSLHFEESVGPLSCPYDRMERLERLDRLDRLDRLERLDQLERGKPASSVAVSRQPSQRPIILPPTTVVVNLGESIGPPATVSGYDLQRHPSPKSHEEVRAPRYQQPPSAPLTTQMTQQMRELARQYQQPMGDDVVSMTERVIYEVIRKKESATETSEGAASPAPIRPPQSPPGFAIRPPQSPGLTRPPQSPGMMMRAPQSPGFMMRGQRSPGFMMRGQQSPGFMMRGQQSPGFMMRGQRSPGFIMRGQQSPGFMMRGQPSPGFMMRGQQSPGFMMRGQQSPGFMMRGQRSPGFMMMRGQQSPGFRMRGMSPGGGTPGRQILQRVPSRVGTPRLLGISPSRTPMTTLKGGGDGMSLFPERSLIMLLVFLFIFVLVVVILAVSGLRFPGFGKRK